MDEPICSYLKVKSKTPSGKLCGLAKCPCVATALEKIYLYDLGK
jgi:hypothetical protein